MWVRFKSSLPAVIAILVLLSLFPIDAAAQCYLDQGCKPVDNLYPFTANGTGQVFHGDGAASDGNGGWTNYWADLDQCLGCHGTSSNINAYLKSGHKNTMRKIAPGVLWAGPDGDLYSTNDDHYGSQSTYDWVNGTVTVGGCNVFAVITNGLPALDPSCSYPYYTVLTPDAPPYTTVDPTVAAGGVRDLYYIFGGWMKYGGLSDPQKTKLNTIFDEGFTGGLYPNGNFSCARCHATGYNFDASGREPTKNTNDVIAGIPNSEFQRLPSDGYIAPGTSGTSSWFLTGVQCERCHFADTVTQVHPYSGPPPTKPLNEAATALCLECHRTENITKADYAANPPVEGSINPTSALKMIDRGSYCSDLSGSSYSDCVSISGNTWIYTPRFQHEAGASFLNSPHARFSGDVVQNAQHSPNLTVTLNGTYHSQFSPDPSNPSKNRGCTGCHNPHKSTVKAVNASNPFQNRCVDCHALAQNILNTTPHPTGPGTPFWSNGGVDVAASCMVCHMVGADGVGKSHLVRISTDPNYYTFPSASQFYTQGTTAPATAPETSRIDGYTFNSAAWLDVDITCGQCHVGGDGVTNPYGVTLPPGQRASFAFTRAQLAQYAQNIHGTDPTVPVPTYDPAPGTYTTIQMVTISDSLSGATIYYTTDGTNPTTSSSVFTDPIAISASTTVRAFATYPGLPSSPIALGQYTISLPTAPPPSFSPVPSLYSSAQSVTLSNSGGLPMYYTIDGSTPTESSTPYAGPISVTQNTTIKAITAASGYLTSPVVTGVYSIKAPTPTFSPSGGTYTTQQTVNISDSVSGATIYYTTNGSTPTTSSTACTNPCSIQVSTTTTIKAIASGGGFASSNVASATYTFKTATPTFSPSGGTYYSPQTVTISDASSGATIYYTTNGTFPTTSSTSCASPCPVAVSTTTTIKAMAIAPGLSQSSVGYATYFIKAATPTFSPGSGTYTGPLSVTISDATSGVTIYYTTDGSYPTTSSTACSNPCPVTVSVSATVKAIAAGGGYDQSALGFASYTIH